MNIMWKEITRKIFFLYHAVFRLPASSSAPEVLSIKQVVPCIRPLGSFLTHGRAVARISDCDLLAHIIPSRKPFKNVQYLLLL